MLVKTEKHTTAKRSIEQAHSKKRKKKKKKGPSDKNNNGEKTEFINKIEIASALTMKYMLVRPLQERLSHKFRRVWQEERTRREATQPVSQ